jgi:hypothetical protein
LNNAQQTISDILFITI